MKKFNYKLHYVKGVDNVVADYLSRHLVIKNNPKFKSLIKLKELVKLQKEDKQIIRFHNQEKYITLSIDGYRTITDKKGKICIPKVMQKTLQKSFIVD